MDDRSNTPGGSGSGSASGASSGLGAGGGATGSAEPASPQAAAALAGLGPALQSAGGIDGVMEKLRGAGLSDKVDSWVSTQPNQQVDPATLGRALGPDTVQKMSSHTGLDVGQLLPLLAAALPQLVNMLTPNGNVPSGGLDHAAGPNIGGLIGGLLGGSGGAGSTSGELENVLGGLGGILGGNRG